MNRRIFGAHAAHLRRCDLRFSLTHQRMRSLRCSIAPSIWTTWAPNLSPRSPAMSTNKITPLKPPKWDEEIELLARALPPDLAHALHERTDPRELLEIVLDLGREPEARVPGREVLLADHPVSASDLEHVTNNVGQFGDDNPAGIERTLHRVSAT